jgi:hypothetical protein
MCWAALGAYFGWFYYWARFGVFAGLNDCWRKIAIARIDARVGQFPTCEVAITLTEDYWRGSGTLGKATYANTH